MSNILRDDAFRSCLYSRPLTAFGWGHCNGAFGEFCGRHPFLWAPVLSTTAVFTGALLSSSAPCCAQQPPDWLRDDCVLCRLVPSCWIPLRAKTVSGDIVSWRLSAAAWQWCTGNTVGVPARRGYVVWYVTRTASWASRIIAPPSRWGRYYRALVPTEGAHSTAHRRLGLPCDL